MSWNNEPVNYRISELEKICVYIVGLDAVTSLLAGLTEDNFSNTTLLLYSGIQFIMAGVSAESARIAKPKENKTMKEELNTSAIFVGMGTAVFSSLYAAGREIRFLGTELLQKYYS